MVKQKGAALIVVLSLLTVSLMVGLSSMQSSHIDERLAGNYKASAQAQMAAEEAASAGWGNIDNVEDDDWVKLSGLTGPDLEDLTWVDIKSGVDGGCQSPVSCYYRYIEDGDDKYIVAMGGVEDGGVSVSEPVIVKVLPLSGSGNFASTSVIGDIEDGAIQFPSSSGSELSGGSYESDGEDVPVSAFMFEEGMVSYDMDDIVSLGEKAALTYDNTSYFVSDIQTMLNLLKDIYDSYLTSGSGGSGGGTCSGICFYENRLKETGNGTLEGVHVVLNGDVQIGGNADVQGVLIVLNLGTDDDDALSWSAADLEVVEKVKLNGGGNKGTVWFDKEKVKTALESVDITLEEFFGNSGGGGGGDWGIESWQ